MKVNYGISFMEIRIVNAIFEANNITAAAKALNIPKASVITALNRFEKKVGYTLFNRRPGSSEISVSEEAHHLKPTFRNLLQEHMLISNVSNKLASTAYGRLFLTSTQTLLDSFFTPHFADLKYHHPELDICFRQKDESYYSEKMFDEIFLTVHSEDTDTYEYFPFHTFQQKVWASPSYIKKRGEIKDLRDLKKHHQLLVLISIIKHETIIDNDFLMKQVGLSQNANNVIKVSGPKILDTLAESGAGLMLASYETVKLTNLNLIQVLPAVSGQSIPIYLKVNRQFLSAPYVKLFIDWVFYCRDMSLTNINVPIQSEHTPLTQEKFF